MNGGTARRRAAWPHRARLVLARYQWLLLSLLGLVGVVFGYVGYATLYHHARPPASPVDLLYLIVQLAWFNSYSGPGGLPWTLEVARFLVPAVVLFAAVRGLLVLFYEQVEELRVGRFRGHTIVCGLGRKGLFIARQLCEQGEDVVVVERDRAHRDVAAVRNEGARVVIGDAARLDTLRRVRADRARRLVAVTGDDDQNSAIAAAARSLSSAEGGAMECLVHIGDLDLFEAMGEQRLTASKAETFWFELFNIADGAARAALSAYAPFDPTPGAAPEEQAHIAVSGHGPVARSIVAHAGKRWQIAHAGAKERLRVTVLDERSEQMTAQLLTTYPHLTETCDFIPPESGGGYASYMRPPRGTDGRPLVTAVYVCGDGDNGGSWPTALRLEQSLREFRVPVVLFTLSTDGVAALVDDGTRSLAGGGLKVFSALEAACEPDLLFGGLRDELARAIHEDYVRAERAKPGGPSRKHDDDRAMRPWSRLDEDLRDQNRDQAADIRGKLDAVGCGIAPLVLWDTPPFIFDDGEVELLSQREHERWTRFKSSQGWQYGRKRDDKARLHPDMQPWSELDEPTKEKDRDAVRLIPALLQMAGYRIYRLTD